MPKKSFSHAITSLSLLAFALTQSACSSSSSSLSAISTVNAGQVQMQPLDTKSLRDATRVRLVSGKTIAQALLVSAVVVGAGAAGGSAFSSGASAGAMSSMSREGSAGPQTASTRTSRAEASQQALADGIAFQTAFREKFAQHYAGAFSRGMASHSWTKNHISPTATHTVDCVIDWSWHDEKSNRYYLYAELTVVVKDAQGREVLKTEAYAESRKSAALPAHSMDDLLRPEVFESHVRACADNAGPYVAQVLADEIGWE